MRGKTNPFIMTVTEQDVRGKKILYMKFKSVFGSTLNSVAIYSQIIEG